MVVDATFLALFLDESVDILAEWERSCLEYEQTQNGEAAESLYRCAHNLKSGSAAVGLSEFSAFVHHIEDVIAKLLNGSVQSSPEMVKLFLEVQSILMTWCAKLRDDSSFVPKEAKIAQVAKPAAKVSDADLIIQQFEAESAAFASADPVPSQHVSSDTPMAVEERPAPEVKATHSSSRPIENIRVAANKLDMLIQLVGELTTQQAIIWHGRQNGSLTSKSCDNAIQLVQKNAKDLQTLAMSLRMQPLQGLFQRLQRAASDLARAQDKKLDVVLDGDHVELDRAVIERITEAMMHVVRNAVDHGIEDQVSRFDANKSLAATLRFEGSQEPGGIMIRVIDDGRGLNLERILKKAIEKGLADPKKTYTASEIQRFIFAHGFSTAEKVTDVSGRGVGMDVVRNSVQEMGGTIGVSSVAGKGTTFSISLPASLSIVDALIITANANRYAIPVQDVTEIIDLSAFQATQSSSGGRLLSLRDVVIPVECLDEHLPQSAVLASKVSNDIQQNIKPALLIKTGRHSLAFEVDSIIGQQPVSLRSLPRGLDKIPGFTGGAILGDGEPCVILNLPELVRRRAERFDKSGSEEIDHDAADMMREDEDATRVRSMVFRVRDSQLSTSLLGIREILSEYRLSPVASALAPVLGCVDVRGQILTVLDLGYLLGMPRLTSEEAQQNQPLLIVEAGLTTIALMVDRIESVADLDVSDGSATPDDQAFNPIKTNLNLKGTVAKIGERLVPVIEFQHMLSTFVKSHAEHLQQISTAIHSQEASGNVRHEGEAS